MKQLTTMALLGSIALSSVSLEAGKKEKPKTASEKQAKKSKKSNRTEITLSTSATTSAKKIVDGIEEKRIGIVTRLLFTEEAVQVLLGKTTVKNDTELQELLGRLGFRKTFECTVAKFKDEALPKYLTRMKENNEEDEEEEKKVKKLQKMLSSGVSKHKALKNFNAMWRTTMLYEAYVAELELRS